MEEIKKDYKEVLDISSKTKPKLVDSFEFKHLNRYGNITPYKDTMVTLNTGSKYINANYVKGIHTLENDKHDYHYIATQAPVYFSLYDFWAMVLEHKIETIIMIINPQLDFSKYNQYWKDGGKFKVNDISVKMLSLDENDDYDTRTFLVKRYYHEVEVKHYNYKKWEDMSTTSVESLYKFINHVNNEQGRLSRKIVHCSAGVGRTGSYILIDTILNKIADLKQKNVIKKINMKEVLIHLRKYRMSLVQTVEQYILCRNVILYDEENSKFIE